MAAVLLPKMKRFVQAQDAYPFAQKKGGEGMFSDPRTQMNPLVPIKTNTATSTVGPSLQPMPSDSLPKTQTTPNSLSFSATVSPTDTGVTGGSLYARGGVGGKGLGPAGGAVPSGMGVKGASKTKGKKRNIVGSGHRAPDGTWVNTQPVSAPTLKVLSKTSDPYRPGYVWNAPSSDAIEDANFQEFSNSVSQPQGMAYTSTGHGAKKTRAKKGKTSKK